MQKKEAIAIVGIGAIIPGAQDCARYWNNILQSQCFIEEIPEDFWKIEDFFDPNPEVPDKTYSKRAGIVGNINFDAMEFGIPPKVMQSTSSDQLYSLVAARTALIDAGLYGKNENEFDFSRTGVIISANVAKNAFNLSLRTNSELVSQLLKSCNVPETLRQEVIRRYKDSTLEWDEASNPGYLPSVCAGRIANRFNFGGTSCSIDSACASGLFSVKFAAQELLNGNCDIMLAGGVSLDLSSVTYISFCKTPALSLSDNIRPFDKNSDGMLLGDGVGILVLKRLSDAQKNKDRIYATIEGIGTSSDGKASSIYAPNKNRQKKAILNAIKDAHIDKSMIGMIEAHGTGTLVGDSCEVNALKEIFDLADNEKRSVVLGSAKGQIGHLRLAAGIMGLIRLSLALYHKQYIPSVGCETVNPEIESSGLCVLKKPLPWIINKNKPIRYGGVSAFGFGGANCHIILKESQSEHDFQYRLTNTPNAIIFAEKEIGALKQSIVDFKIKLSNFDFSKVLTDYSYRKLGDNQCRLAFIARDSDEALKKADKALEMIEKDPVTSKVENEITYNVGAPNNGKVATVFSGQGTQYLNMFSELTGSYPEIRTSFTLADNEMLKKCGYAISDIVYPKICVENEVKQSLAVLNNTLNTQMCLAALLSGIFNAMNTRGYTSDYFAGHSFGELVALYASGSYDLKTLMKLSVIRASSMADVVEKQDMTGMLAIISSYDYVTKLLVDHPNVYIANINSLNQIVVSGSLKQLALIEGKLANQKISCKRLSVSAAFHSPYMEEAKSSFDKKIATVKFNCNQGNVISNYTNEYYKDSKIAPKWLSSQLTNPVNFKSNIASLYKKGVRIFVEIGAGDILSKLIKSTLSADDYAIISICPNRKSSTIDQFEFALAQLAVLGVEIKKDKYSATPLETEIKPGKGVFSVPPTYYMSQETIEKMNNAKKPMDIEQTETMNYDTNQSFVAPEKIEEDSEMIKLDAILAVQERNANIFEKYLSSQELQLEYIKELSTNLIDSIEKRALFECISNFQNNSMVALQSYYDSQTKLLSNQEKYTNAENNYPNLVQISKPPVSISEHTVVDNDSNSIKPITVKEDTVIVTSNCKDTQQPDEDNISNYCEQMLISIIVQKTGYPEDMISTDMEIEGDLGIDSIKRIEIFSEVNDLAGNIFNQEDFGELATVQTVSECIEILNTKLKY